MDAAKIFCENMNVLFVTYLRKLREHSVATAFASNVFPVPGGPYNNTPIHVR
jgi:hypothetical protein